MNTLEKVHDVALSTIYHLATYLPHYLLVSAGLLMLPSCSAIMDWQTKYPDNGLEQKIEEGIEDVSGFQIDLTPITGTELQNDLLNQDLKQYKY